MAHSVSEPGYVDNVTQVFEGTVGVEDKDGNYKLSDRVGKGEKLYVAEERTGKRGDKPKSRKSS